MNTPARSNQTPDAKGRADTGAEPSAAGRFWLVLHEPGCVPEMKGPWPDDQTKDVLREFMAARPAAYIDLLTVDHGEPSVRHGAEVLQMADGRSMSVGRRHNASTRAAHEAHHASPASPEGGPTGAPDEPNPPDMNRMGKS